MKVGVVGVGAVGSACSMSLVLRGSAREIVLVDRTRKRAAGVATDLKYGAALSLPSVLGREGVTQILEPEMSDAERRALERSAETLRNAVGRAFRGN
jgi:malate/lactate dehydrogenase